MNIGKDAAAVRAACQLTCPVCGKTAVRRENGPSGTAYLHLTKRGSKRCFVGKETRGEKKKDPSIPLRSTRDDIAEESKEGGRRAG